MFVSVSVSTFCFFPCLIGLQCSQKRAHPDKVTCEEEEAIKDPAVRKKIKEAAAEVEKTEGRGQLKVIVRRIITGPLYCCSSDMDFKSNIYIDIVLTLYFAVQKHSNDTVKCLLLWFVVLIPCDVLGDPKGAM